MKTNELYLKTAFCCMACDGDIATEEIELIKEYVAAHPDLFADIDIEQTLNIYINAINRSGAHFLMAYIDELANDTLSENEKLEIIRLAISIIEADKNIEYSEVSFFKRIRTQFRTLSDEQILNILPGREIFMLPDNNEDKYDFEDFKFDNIKLSVIVKTCSDIFYTIGQKKCPMPSAKIRNYSHSHNLVSQ